MPMRQSKFFTFMLVVSLILCISFTSFPAEATTLTGVSEGYLWVAFILSDQLRSGDFKSVRNTNNFQVNRQTVAIELQSHARQTQSNLLAHLRSLQNDGKVRNIKSLWLINAVVADVSPAVLDDIISYHTEIDRCHLLSDGETDSSSEFPVISTSDLTADDIPWNLNDIAVPPVWDYGYHGQGIIIGLIDTGVDYLHSDLADHIWINPGEDLNGNGIIDETDWNNQDDDNNGYIDDLRGWTFGIDNPEVMDTNGSGTWAAGILVGDGAGGTTTGIAPEAKIMVLNNTYGQEAGFWEAQQYALLMGADFVTGSLVYYWHYEPTPDYAAMRNNCDLLLEADMLQISPAGGVGNNLSTDPIPFNIALPGICPPPWQHSDQILWGQPSSVLSVGAYDAGHAVISQSSIGPSAWYLDDVLQLDPEYPYQDHWPINYNDFPFRNGQDQGLIKPDLCAPSGVQTTQLGGGYKADYAGTQCAAMHLAGVTALLKSAHPEASPGLLSEALMTTCIDFGQMGKDNLWGCGQLQAFDALVQVMLDIGGHLTGTVIDSLTQQPISGVTVSIETWSNSTDSSGSYLLLGLPEALYDVSFSVPGYIPMEMRDVQVQAGEFTTLNVSLLDSSVGLSPENKFHSVPSRITVCDPYPNPFNASTKIEFYLPSGTIVKTDVVDLAGKKVFSFESGFYSAGSHFLAFEGENLPSGLYILRLKAAATITYKKLFLLK